jgi:hypothetical protein
MSAVILHRHGGTITAITHIGHETHRKVANWFFRGDVTWFDGSKSVDIEIAPHAICHDDTDASKARVNNLLEQLNTYLVETGEWLEKSKHMRDGRVVNWVSPATSGLRMVAA